MKNREVGVDLEPGLMFSPRVEEGAQSSNREPGVENLEAKRSALILPKASKEKSQTD